MLGVLPHYSLPVPHTENPSLGNGRGQQIASTPLCSQAQREEWRDQKSSGVRWKQGVMLLSLLDSSVRSGQGFWPAALGRGLLKLDFQPLPAFKLLLLLSSWAVLVAREADSAGKAHYFFPNLETVGRQTVMSAALLNF